QLFLSTINKNPRSWITAIVGAEYLFNILPKGTHEFSKFIKPSELARPLREAGLIVKKPEGITYDLFTDEWRRSTDISMNYMLAATRPAV
ncbi:MAG: bifunctional 3-demethylubiquinol 3-O-methyltransferase/2-polyprenyl-6-hydroxyphenol methylase, partial [Alphaproteobacteria bacterium]